MKFNQTLYFSKSADPFKLSFGWAAPEYHLMGWALSCLQLNNIYGKVDLYASTNAAKLLINILGLPYSDVYVTHDNLHIANENLWALPKILTYSLQSEPFLHFDGDVFLFGKLPASLLNADLIAQNMEEATDYYLSTQVQLKEHFSYFPGCVKSDFESNIPIKAVNAGILGGKNIEFIKEYSHLAFKYINKNADNLSKINVDRFNVFFEQHLFYSLANEKGIKIDFLFQDTIKDNEYLYLGNFHETPFKLNYLHLLGHFKKDEYTCMQMAVKLRELYPEYYYKIISLCKQNKVPLSTSFYNDKEFNTARQYLDFTEKAKNTYADTLHQNNLAAVEKIDISDPANSNISALTMLQKIITERNDDTNILFSKSEIEIDFKKFSENLQRALKLNRKFSPDYLYGRDLDSVNWHCNLFAKEQAIMQKVISKCDELTIIESGFDWAGLFNKHKRVGVRYYQQFELSHGQFFNLILPEVFANGFSLFDLDEMEKIILDHLCRPLSIETLLLELRKYVEEEVIENNLDEYNNLVITLIKQLVLKKAVRPNKRNDPLN